MKKDSVKFEVGQLWRTRVGTLVEIIDVNVPCNHNMYTIKVREVESGKIYTVEDVSGYYESYYDKDCMDEDLKHYVGMDKVKQITYKTVTLVDKIIAEEIEVMQDTPYISKTREDNMLDYIVSPSELMQVKLEVEHIDIKTFIMDNVEYSLAFSKEVKESLLYKMLDSVMTERDNLLIKNRVIKRDNDILRFNLEAGNASKSNWFINLFKRIKKC